MSHRLEAKLGNDLSELWKDHSEWSQNTFGSDDVRGPAGPLKHLAKEANEALAAYAEFKKAAKTHPHLSGVAVPKIGISPMKEANKVRDELADCLILVLDASRRAGLKILDLVSCAKLKLEVNRLREWPTPTTDEPVEHVRKHTQ